MKITTIIAVFVITACVYTSCSKNGIPTVNGNINGVPAITLYGNSNQQTDYVFLVKSEKEMSYNGLILSYVYAAGDNIFIIYAGNSVAKGTLDTSSSKTVLTIETTFGFTFTSTIYTSN